jgi:hypothetical protein
MAIEIADEKKLGRRPDVLSCFGSYRVEVADHLVNGVKPKFADRFF